MKKNIFLIFFLSFAAVQVYADCPLDHFIIGINEDGIAGTDDDDKLFVDCTQKYRSSGPPDYLNWHYQLNYNFFYLDYKWRLGEPGFDGFHGTNQSLVGDPNEDYRIMIECISISSGFRVVYEEGDEEYHFTIDQIGQYFNHSGIQERQNDNPHMHLSYQAIDGSSLFWITWQMYDALGQYEPSEPFTLVFNTEPLAGDLVVDGTVDSYDLAELSYYWLRDEGSINNDYYERADSNRDGKVNFLDFAMLASNWLDQL